jgi:hypothetical protein
MIMGETHPELDTHIEWELAHGRTPQLQLCSVGDMTYWRVKPIETLKFEAWLQALREGSSAVSPVQES